MNIHHLELFYYVAKHGGISEAVRNIPYGIQQPAVSAQVGQLEQTLGITLFQRRPFALTGAGEELFLFIQPFFENLNKIADRIRGGISQHIRIGASEIILREHLPGIIERVRTKYPNMRVSLRQGYQPELEVWLKADELDMAVTLLQCKVPQGLRATTLMEVPLILLVPKKSRIKSAEELWEQERITESLISLPANEAIVKTFQDGLRRREVEWPIGMEVSSLALIESYVENGYGIGLSVLPPLRKISSQIRVLPLPGFETVMLGVLWRGNLNPVTDAFLGAMQDRVQQLLKATNGGPAELPALAAVRAVS
jgi:DNA-binding transcriptional LysR family regulator